MRSVNDILDACIKYGKLKNDAALSRALKVKPNTISTWRTRGMFNYDIIVAWCDENNIPPAWILTGQVTVRQENIEGQIVTRPANEPGLYRQDKVFREMQVERDTLAHDPVIEDPHLIQTARRIAKPQVKALVNDLLDILESDDAVMITAITENIKAFKESVNRKSKLEQVDAERDFKPLGAQRVKHRVGAKHEGGRD